MFIRMRLKFLAIPILWAVSCFPVSASEHQIRIGVALQPSNALIIVALENGYMSAEGLEIDTKTYPSGKRALLDGLFTGDVDLVSASDAPIVFNSFARQDFSVIASIYSTDNFNRVIARRDRGIAKPADLRGKRMATQKASAVHFFLHLFLLENGLSEKDVQLSYMKAGKLPGALARGDIDAFSMREPFISQAAQLLGQDNAIIFAEPGLYDQSDQVVVLKKFLKEKPDVIRRFLKALSHAETFISNNTQKAVDILTKVTKGDRASLVAGLSESRYKLELTQSLFLRLEDEAQWVIEEKLTRHETMPNFLHFIDPAPLKAVRPDTVTIIK